MTFSPSSPARHPQVHDGVFLCAPPPISLLVFIHSAHQCQHFLFFIYFFALKVWFQNRRSKERRMKQLSTLNGRRHVFFRGQRRMRALGERLEAEELGHFSYYGGELCGGGGVKDWWLPPDSQSWLYLLMRKTSSGWCWAFPVDLLKKKKRQELTNK